MNEDNDPEELMRVLTEFHQRVMAEPNQSTGVPPPFRITTSVQSLHPMKFPERRRRDEAVGVGSQSKGVAPATSFDLIPYGFKGNQQAHRVEFYISLRCHAPATIGQPMYIMVRYGLEAPQWGGLAPTVPKGPALMGFNGSLYTAPPLESGQYADVIIYFYPQNVPPAHPPPQTVAGASFAIYMQRASDSQILGELHGGDTYGLWQWMPSANGIGFSFQMSY
jgi:hypothetical protein